MRTHLWTSLCLILLAALRFSPAARAQSDTNTIVRFEIQRGTNALGSLDVELFDHDKPDTVRNFLLYVRSGAYSNSFLHRCVPSFVVQGGGFAVTNLQIANSFSSFLEVTNYGRLMNEFSVGPQLSNTFGTIAMAKVGDDPNSATSQWFFNLANNTNLDTQNGGFTVFGRILSNTNASNVLAHFNTLSTTGGVVNLRNLLGSTYAAFTDLPVAYTNSTTRVPFYRELYSTRIFVLNETNVPSPAPPTLQVAAPPPNSSFTNQDVTVTGTAGDDTGVARVVYRAGNAAAQGASGSTNWQFTMSPQLGLNVVSIESIDWEGRRSPPATVSFLYFSEIPLNLEIIGSGRVAGASNGQLLQVGTYQTLTAIPSSGYLFHSWSGAVTSTLASISFFVPTNATNISLTARFVAEPLPRLAGSYSGLFMPSGTPAAANSGSMTMQLETSGNFSGKIFHRMGTYSFTGKFDQKGQAVIQGDVGGTHRTISLELQATNNQGLIIGAFAGTTTDVRLERLASALPANGSVTPGAYTFAIPPPLGVPADQLTPGGYGYGTCTVDSTTGLLTYSGRLGDGQPFSGSAKLTRLRRWPLYLDLFNGRGVLLGWLGVATNAPGNLDGVLHWIKGLKLSDATYPAGFTNQVFFLGSRYNKPAAGNRVANWVYGQSLISGHFQLGISNLFKLDVKNDLTSLDANPAGVTLDLDPATGSVTGTFIDPWTGTTRNLRGTVLKRTQSILGHFVDRGTVGIFQIGKSPFLPTQTVDNVTLPAVLGALSEGGYLQFATNAVLTFDAPVEIRYDTALDANGHELLFSGGGQTRLFHVLTNRLFIAKGVTFADGKFLGAAGADTSPPQPGGEGCGAGILNQGGTIALTNCVLTNFFAQGGRGGKEKSTGLVLPGGRACGAAIYNAAGRLTLSGCYLADNFAEGGIGNADPVTDLLSAQGGSGVGGAVFSERGECQVETTTFLRNRAGGGTGRSDSPVVSRGGEGVGGALAVSGGRLQLSLSTFGDNRALGATATTNNQIVGGAHGGALLIETNATALINESTLTNNAALGGASSDGPALGAARAGAIFSGGSLEIRRSTIEQNTAQEGGGVLSRTNLIVDASTMIQNSATAGFGGALLCYGGSLAATNSTFAFNSSQLGGGALMLVSNSAVLLNMTIALNTNGGIALSNSSLRLRNSILASNTPQNFAGAILDEGYNFSSDASASLSSVGSTNNIDPLLGAFSANGGPTRTFALLVNSPARDVVPANLSPPVDQRGTNRVQGPRGDIGAFELSPAEAPPSFAVQPSGGTVRAGTNFTFQVVANGAAPLTYTWLQDGATVPDATNSTFVVTNAQMTADYFVIVANRYGSATSAVVRLTVDSRPIITGEPSDASVPPGATVTFAVGVTGPALTYMWFQNGVPIPGANGPSLSLTNAAPGMQGGYRVVITNFSGAATSRLATLTFNSSALAIFQQPASLVIGNGTTATFNVGVSGVPPFSYAWLFGSTPIPNATNQQFSFAAGFTNQGQYRVVVSNAYLTVTSAPATLTVLNPPLLSIRIDGNNAIITCQGTPNRLHQLFQAPSLSATQTWTLLATNTPSASGTSTWTRPLIPSQNSFFRVAIP